MTIKRNIHLRQADSTKINRLSNFGGTSPDGSSLEVNSRYFLKDGKPWVPIMGEFHFSRYPNAFWEESILKMKAGGIEVLATYVFWIHHEEIEGEFIWKDNFDLGRFIRLCGENNMKVLLRIGPWAHGECRNGGFPDWLLKKDMVHRSNDEKYLKYVRILYSQIFEQVKGMLFKESGPIIGVQLENEYGHCGGFQGEEGMAHMRMLKKIAVEVGFDVPFYTATGWGGGIVVDGETLPVLGAYADAPWAQHIEELPASPEFVFSGIKKETDIGTDLKTQETADFTYQVDAYPYATAELGGGLQVTKHRRPIVSPHDVEVIALVKLGSGANLLGYYMYHGGTNPMGKLSTLQESRETGYLNDLPVLSYDFQAPIREYGQISDAYKNLKILHMFLNDFGDRVATASCFIPEDSAKDPEDKDTLRYSVRNGNEGGFLFINNYQRHRRLNDKQGLEFTLRVEDKQFDFEPFNLSNGRRLILPYNMNLDGVKLLTATAQPLCKLNHGNESIFVFFSYEDEKPAYAFSTEGIGEIEASDGTCSEEAGQYKVFIDKPGTKHGIRISLNSGRGIRVYTIGRKEAEYAWKISDGTGERLVVTEANLVFKEGSIVLTTRKPLASLSVFPDFTTPVRVKGAELLKTGTDGHFTKYELSFRPVPVKVSFEEVKENQDGTKVYKIHMSTGFGEGVGDNFLKIAFEGDQAKMYFHDKYSADWFYTGMDWEIGLKRFAKELPGADVRIEIAPLAEDACVYLERKPRYENGKACRMLSAVLEPEYLCEIVPG